MFVRLLPAVLVVVGLLSLAGCTAKLNVTKTYEQEVPTDADAIDLDPQSKPQKLTVAFTSTNAAVSVYVFKESDAKGDAGLTDSDPAKALGKETGKSGSFTVDVPENTAIRVIIRGAEGKTKIEVKITN